MAIEMSDRIKAKIGMAKAWLKATSGESDEKIIEVLRERGETMIAAIRKQNDEQSLFAPAEGEWCTREVGRHVINSHKNVSGMMQMLAAGKAMEGGATPGIVPDGPESLDAICEELGLAFERLEAAFRKVCREGANLELTYTHPWFGELNARQWGVFCGLHTTAHIDQVERIAGSVGFPKN